MAATTTATTAAVPKVGAQMAVTANVAVKREVLKAEGLPSGQRTCLGLAGPMSRPRYQGTMQEASDPLLGVTIRNVSPRAGVTFQGLRVRTRFQTESPIEVDPRRRIGIRDEEVHPRGDYHQGSVFPMALVMGGAQRPTRGYSMPLAEPPPVTSLGVKSVNQRYRATMLDRLMVTVYRAWLSKLKVSLFLNDLVSLTSAIDVAVCFILSNQKSLHLRV